jgi:adenylate kinase
MAAIIVSGTPGTGKTTLAKRLAKLSRSTYIDVNKVIEDNKLAERFDEARDTKVIDVKRLNKVLVELIQKGKDVVIDSHLSHYLPKRYVDKCYITKCNLKELKKRLEKRGYSDAKVRENLDAEIFDVCRIEARENGHEPIVVDTSTE